MMLKLRVDARMDGALQLHLLHHRLLLSEMLLLSGHQILFLLLPTLQSVLLLGG